MRAIIQSQPTEVRDSLIRLVGDFTVTHQPSWADNHILVATTPEDKLLMYVAKHNLSLDAPCRALYKLRTTSGLMTLVINHTVAMATIHIYKD